MLVAKILATKFGFVPDWSYMIDNSIKDMKIIGHIGHFRWLGPNVWWEISQIWIDYIKPIGQMFDES